jgi:NodT family efflux transporter outer membrane factor (OMF) lipoprotein
MRRLAAILAVFAAGCAVGPDYERPNLASPVAWSRPTEEAGDLSRWWTTLGDPVLDELVERALAGNFDLARAEMRLREARALRSAAVADFLPDGDLKASVTRQSYSEGSSSPRPELRQDLYQADFDASWELDLWGGKRRALEAASASVEAFEEAAREVRVALCAEVARNYVEYRAARRRLAIAAEGLRGRDEILELTRARFDAGMARDAEVARAEAQVESLRADASRVELDADRALHRLAVLCARWPESLREPLAAPAPIPLPPPAVPGGVPAGLLERRPDLRRAERELAAATAKIGVAVDAMLPHVSLLGSLGLESVDSQFFFRASSGTWAVGPALTWRFLSLPQLYAEVRAADARAAEALLAWRGAALAALEDVENALAAGAREDARRAALARAVAANERAVARTKDLYRQGMASFLDVLNSEEALLESRNLLAESDAAVANNRIALFKALGGGWEAPGK